MFELEKDRLELDEEEKVEVLHGVLSSSVWHF